MAELGLIVDLVVVAAAALVGGGAARLLRQPTMVGYIVAGIAIGPYTPGPIGDVARVRTLAEVGVVLLMFTIGVELSLTRLAVVRDVAVYGGALQIVLTAAVGAVLGGWLGLPLAAALLFGAIVALSSTVVALRVLADRGQLGALHGRVALGVCLVQDLAVVPLIVVLPALGGPPEQLVGEVALALAKAAAILAIAYWLGGVLVPRVMQGIAAAQSRELFLLATIGLALGTALVASAFGLSLAVGAFLAGLVVSESEVQHEVLGAATPLRDLFATFFFVSLGMLLDPLFVVLSAGALLATLAAVVVAKGLITATIVRAFGYTPLVAAGAALAVAQVGEMSFVVAALGTRVGLLRDGDFALLLAVALLSMLATPPLSQLARIVAVPLRLVPVLPWIRRAVEVDEQRNVPAGHTVVCGYGRVGQELVDMLRQRGFRCLVIEQSPQRVRALRSRGVAYLFGDAANRVVLEHANLRHARALAITFPDDAGAEGVARLARELNPRLDVIVRVHSAQYARRLWSVGAAEVVRPEFEAALEFARHVFHRYGLSGPEIQALLSERRSRLTARE
ncbi:MAG: cation:proton antiporter [Chloroflexi bacterium]|nr:cation:proton antiporter [Chloroflexota bacterium]